MTLELPNLDDRRYASLVAETIAQIPTYDPDWTNYNPSDPGITLVQLFAWLAEMMIYRANRIADAHLVTFLRLLNGPEWSQKQELPEEIRESVGALRRRHNAVTPEDYEAMAREASKDVARARCVAQTDLGATTADARAKLRPGHVSIVVLPQAAQAATDDPLAQPSAAMRENVRQHLDNRRVLTTRLHIVGPIYAPIHADILVARRADVRADSLRDDIVKVLKEFLHPLRGGPDGDGWPFGRAVYTAELYRLLEGVTGVDYVSEVVLSSECPPAASRCEAAVELWHEDGDLIGLSLQPHHLPSAEFDPSRIVISSAFLSLLVTIEVVPGHMATGLLATPLQVRRAVKRVVRRRLHPLYGDSEWQKWETRERVVLLSSIRADLNKREVQEVQDVVRVEVKADADRLERDKLGRVIGVRFMAGELADVQVVVGLR